MSSSIIKDVSSSVINAIRRMQRMLAPFEDVPPPKHEPEMLLIGCVDARLNLKDIGIPDGKALIYRNVAALVSGMNDKAGEHLSEAAALEFAINVMHVKDIAVMGHTDCGGIKACLHGADSPETQYIRRYLAPLMPMREEVIHSGGDERRQARAMEEAAVFQSVKNLRTYPAVDKAVREGRVKLHGWVIDTGNKKISEMDIATGRFTPMHQNIQREEGGSLGIA